MTTLSNNIQRLRKAAGLTQAKLGQLCGGLSGPAVSMWESDDNPTLPKHEALIQLAALFKLTVDELLSDPDAKPGGTVLLTLDNKTLEKVFEAIDELDELNYTFTKASLKEKAYTFGLLYSLFIDMGEHELTIDSLSRMLGNSGHERTTIKANNSAKKRRTADKTGKN